MLLLLASTNPNKINEIKRLLGHRPVELKCLSDYENYPSVVEDGHTFKANAGKKAKTIYDYFQIPVLADDSGLEVPALNNAPGVYSARYSGEQATDLSNNRLLLENMRSFEGEDRLARFVCTICYYGGSEEHYFTGITEGRILHEPVGRGGFGYDPLFLVPELNKTYAQLSMSEKNTISHRGKALQKLIEFVDKNDTF